MGHLVMNDVGLEVEEERDQNLGGGLIYADPAVGKQNGELAALSDACVLALGQAQGEASGSLHHLQTEGLRGHFPFPCFLEHYLYAGVIGLPVANVAEDGEPVAPESLIGCPLAFISAIFFSAARALRSAHQTDIFGLLRNKRREGVRLGVKYGVGGRSGSFSASASSWLVNSCSISILRNMPSPSSSSCILILRRTSLILTKNLRQMYRNRND